MIYDITSRIHDDLFYFNEDGSKTTYTAAVAHVRQGGSEQVSTQIIQIAEPKLLENGTYRQAILQLAEEGAMRRAKGCLA